MDSPSLDFNDLTPLWLPASIAGKSYILREASEDAAVKYRNAQVRGARFGADGKPSGIDSVADAEPLLVSLCLFELYEVKGPDGQPQNRERPVLLKQVLSWPARVVQPLFRAVLKLSNLVEEDTQPVLEERFKATARSLAGLASNDAERMQWRTWLVDEAGRAVETTANGQTHTEETLEESRKNLPAAGTAS